MKHAGPPHTFSRFGASCSRSSPPTKPTRRSRCARLPSIHPHSPINHTAPNHLIIASPRRRCIIKPHQRPTQPLLTSRSPLPRPRPPRCRPPPAPTPPAHRTPPPRSPRPRSPRPPPKSAYATDDSGWSAKGAKSKSKSTDVGRCVAGCGWRAKRRRHAVFGQLWRRRRDRPRSRRSRQCRPDSLRAVSRAPCPVHSRNRAPAGPSPWLCAVWALRGRRALYSPAPDRHPHWAPLPSLLVQPSPPPRPSHPVPPTPPSLPPRPSPPRPSPPRPSHPFSLLSHTNSRIAGRSGPAGASKDSTPDDFFMLLVDMRGEIYTTAGRGGRGCEREWS